MREPLLISDTRRKYEIAAVFLTGAGKFIFMDWLNWKLPFILLAITGWVFYVIRRQKQLPRILHYRGFRTDNFTKVLKIVLPFGLTAVVICFCLGFYLGTINLTWHVIPILIIYPIWGTIQQFLVIALVAGNLKDLHGNKLSDAIIIVTTALLFGFLHYPFYWLVFGTFLLALFYGYVYLRARNVYVMGIFHGWLGALFYYTVVGRDPFAELFGNLC
ncbi:MAG TPA: CPBP family intramembrane glutamic endopeptidase [Ohtaekwangia sp.]|nr:CPBP family intramembrane glutamic endopeptidase [Ohtaekwangia sp.]